jgi:hypothetical protein
MAATPEGLQRKSGLAPTGVLRQMPVHSSSRFLIYARDGGKDKPALAAPREPQSAAKNPPDPANKV